MSERRFTDKPDLAPADVRSLDAKHPAMLENRTLFPTTVVEVTEEAPDRLLVSGVNNRKLGATVEKGQFKGYALYGFSLEERATCPATCAQRGVCYGNGMQMARRHRIGDADVFYDRLAFEIAGLLDEHPGLLVRLHVLGDFPSIEYVAFWKDALDENPKLAVYGYTARLPKAKGGDEIGDAIAEVKKAHPARFRIRWSSQKRQPDGATVVDHVPTHALASTEIVCPAQTDATACCATCGLCWESAAREKSILFVKHGPKSNETAAVAVNQSADLDDDQVYELQERVRQLEGEVSDRAWIPDEWKLTGKESALLNLLLKRSILTKSHFQAALYGDDPDGGADPKILDVFICTLRPKLEPFGITIQTVWGEGYKLPPASFAMLDAMSRGLPPPMSGELVGSALARMDVRPIIPIMLPANQKPAKLDLDRPEVRMARIADLKIESAYQRDMTPKSIALIRKIITEWDWAKFKPPICAERDDGSLVVIDGQHTAIAAASHPGLAALPVFVVEAKTVEKRAASFVAHNRDRIAMSPLQLFHAEVAAGVESAIEMLRVVKAAGATVPRSPPKKGTEEPGTVVAIGPARRVLSAMGADDTERLLWIAVTSGIKPISSTVIYALQLLLREEVFAEASGRPCLDIARALGSIDDFERKAQEAAGITGQNRYRAGAKLIADAVLAMPLVKEAAE